MYPERLLQNTTAIGDRHSDILQSYYAILSSYHGLISFGHEFDNIAYNIIPFVSMSITLAIVFLQLSSRYLNQNINIFKTRQNES